MTDEGNKIIKCRCRATGRYFVIEVRRSGGVWAAVNFVDIGAEDAAHIASEVYPEELYTASNLLPCSKNGTRKVASCSLVKTPRRGWQIPSAGATCPPDRGQNRASYSAYAAHCAAEIIKF